MENFLQVFVIWKCNLLKNEIFNEITKNIIIYFVYWCKYQLKHLLNLVIVYRVNFEISIAINIYFDILIQEKKELNNYSTIQSLFLRKMEAFFMNKYSLVSMRDLSKDDMIHILNDALLFSNSYSDWQLPDKALIANLFF